MEPFETRNCVQKTTYDQHMTENHRFLHVRHNMLSGCSHFRFDHGCMPSFDFEFDVDFEFEFGVDFEFEFDFEFDFDFEFEFEF